MTKERELLIVNANAFEQIEGMPGWAVVLSEMEDIRKDAFKEFCKCPVTDLTGKKGIALRAQVRAFDELLKRLDFLKTNKQSELHRKTAD